MVPRPAHEAAFPHLRQLLDEYLRQYLSRDDRLTASFSEDFSGFTGGGDFLVKDRAEWVAITRQDFAQVKEPIRIELKDVAIQSLAPTIAVATAFFSIHLPLQDHILSRETARLVLIFRQESTGWKISHSSISIPYYLVRTGEVYPLQELTERNQNLEQLVAERTRQLSETNDHLRQTNEDLARAIAERTQAEEALHRSEERYRSIVAASPDDITITDMDCRILMVSPAAVRLFGFEREEEGRGRMLTEFVAPEDRERAAFNVAQKCRGVVTGPNEYRALRRDGSSFDIEANSEFIRDAQGRPNGMVFIIRDITERKRAEAEREKLEAQNRQLQKAESLGRMAGAIAHHFNNQLTGVMGNLELAMSEIPGNTPPLASLQLAMQSARKAAEVSQLMRTYLGQTPARREPLDLSQICRQSLALLGAVMPEGMMLVTDLPPSGPIIQADLNQIQHVLTNLVTNAWEAGGNPRGSVHLNVKTVAPGAISATHRFPVGCQPNAAAYACVEVVDAGCGIPDQDVEKIFDPFFSSKFAGRGLGLAVVLGIARSLEGAVTVESEPGQGSIFRVFLPVWTIL